jgi:hypothetical protein
MKTWALACTALLLIAVSSGFYEIAVAGSEGRSPYAMPAGAILLEIAMGKSYTGITLTCAVVIALSMVAVGLFGTRRGLFATEELLGRLTPARNDPLPVSTREAERLEWRCKGCPHLRGVSRKRAMGNVILTPICEGQCGSKEVIIDM